MVIINGPESDIRAVVSSFKVLSSRIRIKILKFIAMNSEGIRYNRIVDALGINSTKLEYHLQILNENRAIMHNDRLYYPNLFTNYLLAQVQNFTHSKRDEYFKTHLLPAPFLSYFDQLLEQKFTIFPNLFQIIDKFDEFLKDNMTEIYIAGKINLDLELSIIKLFNQQFPAKFKQKFIQASYKIISTVDNVHDLSIFFSSPELVNLFDPKNIEIYTISECPFYFGILDSFGILTLPNQINQVDYNQFLLFNEPEGILFLKEIFNNLLKKATKLNYDSFMKFKK